MKSAFVANWSKAKEKCHEIAKTPKGKTIEVHANVGCLEDSIMASDNGADGIGLYRLEHIYLRRNSLPTEEELHRALREAIAPFKNQRVTMRLLDIGADKELDFLDYPLEPNPVVGRRGVRFLFDRIELLRCQLRVLLRLSKDYSLRILVPMVTIEEDIVKVKRELEKQASLLSTERLPSLGAMVETPASALCIGEISLIVTSFLLGRTT